MNNENISFGHRPTLQEILGDKYSDDIQQKVNAATDRMSKSHDKACGAITGRALAYETNRLINVCIKEVAEIIGEDACKQLMDFGPNDNVQLVDPDLMED